VRWTQPSTAHDADVEQRGFYVCHPFHPLYGCWFELVNYRRNWGEDRVYYHDVDGRLRSLPAAWTSVRPEDPFVTVAAGRCYFRTQDLGRLADFVRQAGEGEA
jgi:hypothetical protein